MKYAKLVLLLILSAAFFVACKSEDELPKVDCSGTVAKYSEVSAFQKCTSCHSSAKTGAARVGADTDVNFDTYAAAKASATKAAHEVDEGDMPPQGSGITITGAEEDTLIKWALCGTPE